MNNRLYPLKFKPVYKDKIWGGSKIRDQLKLDFSPLSNCGEAWILSGVEGNQTLVENGFLAGNELNELVEVYMDDLVGGKVYQKFQNQFPVLVKIIDANDWLSIQVHPDDELAAMRHNGSGKTEMWYVMGADQGAELISGFNQAIDRDRYVKSLREKQLKSIMNFEPVSKGDVFYMPSGRVHALGPGIMLAEIQQTSDLTYRIYDWERVDDKGNSRELHTALALDAIDFEFYDEYRTIYDEKLNATVPLVESKYFTTRIIQFNEPVNKDISGLDSFIIYLCTEGKAMLHFRDGTIDINPGETILIPAELPEIMFIPEKETILLEVFID